MSSIPTNRKIQIQKCQGDGTRAIPEEIANVHQHAEVSIRMSNIPTNRKIQQCQGHGTYEVLTEIANVPQHADVTDFEVPLLITCTTTNGEMHKRKVHSQVGDAHRHANVVIDLQMPPLTTNSYIRLFSGKGFLQIQIAESHRKRMSKTKNPQKQNANSRRKKMSFREEMAARRAIIVGILLAYERCNTFTSNGWPRRPGTWWPRVLAEAGFYYRGHDLEVHCYSCKLKTSLRDWCHKVNEAPAEAHARLNRNCEHVVSNGFIPNPNVPEDFQKDDKQVGNSDTCTTLTNVGIPAISKNNSLKTTDTPNAVNGYSCEQRNLTNIVATTNTSNAVSGYSREQRNLTDIAATANASNAVTPEMSDRHQSSIMSPGSTPKDKNNSIGSKNGYRIETLNNLTKSNTSNQILQKETTDSNNSALPQINTSSRKEPSFDGNVGNGNWSLSQDSILKDNNMSIDVRYRDRQHMINNFNHSIDIAQVDASNGMNSQLTEDGLQSYQPEFRYPQYQTLTARKSSYDKWQFGHKQSSDVLSKAGYFYTGKLIIITGSLQLNVFLCSFLFRNCICQM